MQFNHLQPNNTHNASFAAHTATANQQEQGAPPQARPVLPVENILDLSKNPPAKHLQEYSASSSPQGSTEHLATDDWSVPEYQPLRPGEPYLEKLADEAMNTKKVEILLKHARDNEELGDFKDAEETYEKLLKYTEHAEHYKLYAGFLREIYRNLSRVPLAPGKDETKERLYQEKAARAFYYLGDLYKKQGAFPEAQAAYKAACELALYEAPLEALVEATKQLGDSAEIANVLEKLADFYAEKGKIDWAIEKLKEAFEIGKSPKILEKLDALYNKAGGEDSQSQLHEVAIQRFELQLSQDPKNIGLYRQYAWFLKDIGKRNAARAVKERMDERLQQKLVKQKAKIGGLKQTIHLQAGELETLSKKLQNSVKTTNITIQGLKKQLASLENVKFPDQAKNLNSLNKRVKFLEEQVVYLNLSHWPDMQDANCIALLQKNPCLQSLNLGGCKWLTDAVLRILPERFENLQELNLRGCKGLTAAGLDTIAEKASKLKRLTLDGCPGTTIRLLHKLNAKGIAFTIEGLVFPKNRLDLSHRKEALTDSELSRALAANPEITELNLEDCCTITDTSLTLFKNFQWLTSLNLGACFKLTDAGLQHLARLSQLRSLNLQYCQQLTDAGVKQLAGLTQLTSLNLSYQLIDASLKHLAGLSQLTSLGLAYCQQLTDANLKHLAGLSQLRELNLQGTQLTDAGLQQLARLSQLRELNLQGTQLTDAGLQHLARLTQLTSLNLTDCQQLTDAGLQHLARLSQLRSLNLQYCKQLTDAGLQHLARLSQLRDLNLQECSQLTDAGLQHLARLSQLSSLKLNYCSRITHDAKEQLKKQIPGLTIQDGY